MYYCISVNDLPVMAIGEIVLQQKNSSLIAYFWHPRISGRPTFSAQIDFQMRDQGKWYTNFKLNTGTDVSVAQCVRDKVRKQLTGMFASHFDKLIDGGRLW